MSSLTKEQLEFCEICEFQKYTVKQGLICNQTEKPAEFEKVCEKFCENSELKKSRDYFRHQAFIHSKSVGIEVRLLNYFLDLIFIVVLSILFSYGLRMIHPGTSPTGEEGKLFNTFYTIIVFFIYYIVFESLTNRTLAKFITGTKVITTDCKKPKFKAIVIRTLCRLIPLEQLSFLGDDVTGWHDDFSKTVVIFK
jgi:uncharacterized RDD family membrane protein YckC